MIGETESTQRSARSELVITRIFDVPRELVWKAWTDPRHFMRWWGPKDFTAPFCEIDLRVGGRYLNCMRSPDGHEYWTTGVYREIVPLEKLVYTDSFGDEEGNVVSAAYYGMSPDFPRETLVTVTFEDYDGKTKMTLRHSDLPAGEMSEQTGTGWNESFDKLARNLTKKEKPA
ncbi:MAG: SRPBCC domain-containing protein [Anaerolineales bacterium]|nr:SRPBCC domain-containing protein [Anaerolineales bacterium]